MKSAFKINIVTLIMFILCLSILLLSRNNEILFTGINSLGAYSFIWANLTFLGDSLPVCTIMLLFIRKRPDLVWSGIIATLIATLIVNLVKFYFNVPRPPAVIDRNFINIIGPALTNHSFPSGHTVTIFTLAGILMFYFRQIVSRLLILVLACFVGLSRIAIGVHWPIDVLAGAVLGISCAMVSVLIVTKLNWGKQKNVQLIIGFLLIASDIYLLFFYDSKYEQAIFLQISFASIILVAGIREYYLLISE